MDNPSGKFGCVNLPLIGEKCVSDLDFSWFGGGGNGNGGSNVVADPGRDQSWWDEWWGTNGTAATNGTASTTNGGRTVAGCAVTLPVQVTQRAVCPPGYVVVQPAGQGKQCMLKSVAISCHLYKSPAKPPIKASDWRCLKRSAAVVRRLDTIAKTANRVTGKANLSRSRSKR